MVNMLKTAQDYQNRYREGRGAGRLILIDGGSGTGKSTIKDILVTKWKFSYARRDTTRALRPDDISSGDYNFVSQEAFSRKAISGDYIEFRDFLFGMSYGLPWNEFIGPLCDGQNVMALINLGNGFFTKRLFPDATVVLLHADIATIRKRLEHRGSMTEAQIEERLDNNRLAVSYMAAYDEDINTSVFGPAEAADKIVKASLQ
jgi:guanylate kinase